MSRTPTQIIPPQRAPNAVTTLYTVPANRKTVISRITLINTESSDCTIDIHFVGNGDSATASNKIIDGVVIIPGETFSPSDVEAHILPAGSTVQVKASASDTVTVIASGTELT